MGITPEQQRNAAEQVRRFGVGVVKSAEGLKDTAVGLVYDGKQILTNPGEYWDDLKTVVANKPEAIADFGVQAYMK